jgi:hypothetical protein
LYLIVEVLKRSWQKSGSTLARLMGLKMKNDKTMLDFQLTEFVVAIFFVSILLPAFLTCGVLMWGAFFSAIGSLQ